MYSILALVSVFKADKLSNKSVASEARQLYFIRLIGKRYYL